MSVEENKRKRSFLFNVLGLEEVEDAVRELTALTELKRMKETHNVAMEKVEAAMKEIERKRELVEKAKQQDEVIRRQLYEDADTTLFLNLLFKREAVSDLTLQKLKKAVDNFHSKFWSIETFRKINKEYVISGWELMTLIKTLTPLRKALIKCFKEMIEYLESFED